jgi:hypothetical protein
LALVAETYLLCHLPVNWSVSFLIFFATLFLYNLDNLLPYKTAQKMLLTERKNWLLQHQNWLKAVVVFSGVGALSLFIFLLPKVPLVFIIPVFLISILYSLPVLPGRNGKFPLRDIPFLKVFLIALVWAALTVWLPLLIDGKNIDSATKELLILRRVLFIFALTLLFDIRDIKKDGLAGTLTFPVKFGTVFTKFLSVSALLAFAVLVHFQEEGAVRWALELSAVVAGLVVYFTEEDRPDYFFAILADGMMLLQFLIVWFFIR